MKAITFQCSALAYHQLKVLQLSRGEKSPAKTVHSALKALATVMELTNNRGEIKVVTPTAYVYIKVK